MIHVILHGCNGAMGHVISDLLKNSDTMKIIAGADRNTEKNYDYPVYGDISDCPEKADVIIDFSVAAATDRLLTYCENTGTPVVLCTTGLSEEQLSRVKKLSERSAVLRSANMSLGVNLLLKMVKEAAKVLYPADFDIEILEKHHNRKIDAPSGTAIALAESINDALDGQMTFKTDRSAFREKRERNEIGIQAIRGGNIVGEHDVIFAGEDEIITFTHTANSRAIFGKGAVRAAEFLAGKGAGMYSMFDVIG